MFFCINGRFKSFARVDGEYKMFVLGIGAP